MDNINKKENVTITVCNFVTLLAPWCLYGLAVAQMSNSVISYVCGCGLFLLYFICAMLNLGYKNMYGKLMLSHIAIGAFGTVFIMGIFIGYVTSMYDSFAALVSYAK